MSIRKLSKDHMCVVHLDGQRSSFVFLFAKKIVFDDEANDGEEQADDSTYQNPLTARLAAQL